jgi:hypothetical protein
MMHGPQHEGAVEVRGTQGRCCHRLCRPSIAGYIGPGHLDSAKASLHTRSGNTWTSSVASGSMRMPRCRELVEMNPGYADEQHGFGKGQRFNYLGAALMFS